MGFRVYALAMFLAFYGCYVMKLLQQKKQGIQTDQLGKGKTGLVKLIEIGTKIAAVAVFAVGLVSILIDANHGPVLLRFLGAGFSTAGTGVFITAVRAMGNSWRAGVSKTDQTELVTTGIYQISRNPAFLGFDFLYIGTLFLFFNRILLVFTVAAVFMYHVQIVNVEEEHLLDTFGDAYLRYQKKVCRYLGRK